MPQTSPDSKPIDEADSQSRSSRVVLAKIFVAALAIRWTYVLSIYAWMGDAGLMGGNDSVTYSGLARIFADAVVAGKVHGYAWLGDAPYSMPLFHWLTTFPILVFGNLGPLIYVLLQGIIDSATCIIVYFLGRAIDPRLALPAAIVAIVNPTQIVLSGVIYTDTPFTFFVALSFLCMWRWTNAPTWGNAVLVGVAFGCAALIRVLIAPWAFFAITLLAIYGLWKKRPLQRVATLLAAYLLLAGGLGIIVTRSLGQYGEFALTPQGGDYLTLWIVPLAKEAQDRTPFAKTSDLMIQRTKDRYGPSSGNPFEQSRRYQEIGREALRTDIHWMSLVKTWMSGITINLVSPAHLLSPPVWQLPRKGFYDTPGNSFWDKAFNYAFRSGNVTYSILLAMGGLGLLVFRAFQLAGLWRLARDKRQWPCLLFVATWIGFLLILNGPIASPKYRLPLEPFFNVLTAAGVLTAYRQLRPAHRS